jgi:phospho-N-acetylmuramoyl-pentapeptide-transferase
MNYITPAVAFIASFCVAFVLYKIFIPILRRVKLGQKILEIGPNWHKCKEGTPIMGGLFFITATLLITLALYAGGAFGSLSIFFPINLIFIILNALIGFVDDYVKLFKKRNRGLRGRHKLVLQFIVTGAYLATLKAFDLISTSIDIPFADTSVDLGVFYYIIISLVIVYIINSSNLTDGLDGLLGSVAFVIASLFFIIGIQENLKDIYLVQAALCGSLAAFLVFNFHPAKIFMGDTGSLFLGSMLVVCTMRTGTPLLMLLVGIIYVIEGISDILQVAVYKLSGRKKRLFKMAPIHHHFELCGMSEVAIVAIFLGVTVVFSALAYYIYYSI